MEAIINDQCRCYLLSDGEIYGELGQGVIARGRNKSATPQGSPIEIPDFDDRPWDGPYDDDE